MKRALLAAVAALAITAGPAAAGSAVAGSAAAQSTAAASADGTNVTGAALDQRTIERCLRAAARAHRVPASALVILLNVEGGSLGRVSRNTNDTVDIGPMQVNQIWVPQVAARWHATPAETFRALRDNFCANVEAGAWILRRGLDEAHDDFWSGVGIYHSHDPEHQGRYLRAVLRQALRLRSLAEHAAHDRPIERTAAAGRPLAGQADRVSTATPMPPMPPARPMPASARG